MQLVKQKTVLISGVAVRVDGDGRYCLNDLHRAAGEFGHQQPAKFFENASTKDLVSELSNSPNSESIPVKATMGRNGGTYACKELVYAYANWISAPFYLNVIRTFDAVVTGDVTLLPQETRSVIGGIVKGIIHKELASAIADSLPALVHGEIARQQTMVRKGETAGQVWKRHGLMTVGMRGYPTWFGNRLASRGCCIDDGGKAEVGGIASRLFNPDKCDVAMKSGLISECNRYIQNRTGQKVLQFGSRAA
jgi:hypothetical protein